MASSQAEEIKERVRLLRQGGGGPVDLETARAGMGEFAKLTGDPQGVTWAAVDAGGVPAIWAVPTVGADDRVVQYVHGGGYSVGSADFYRKLTGHVANAVGCRLLSVDYRLAPEHPHPAAVEDSTTAYRWLLGQGFAPGHIAIAGDSAGGGLTVTTLLSIRAAGLPMPAAAVAISPWTDLEMAGESMTSRAAFDVMLGPAELKGLADAFLQGRDPRDPLASPIHADLTGLCPLYIQVGGDEVLLDDSVRLAEHARRDGVACRIDVFAEMQHVFQMSAGNMPEADDALRRLGAWARPHLGLA